MNAERRSTNTAILRARERRRRVTLWLNGVVVAFVASVVCWGAYAGFKRLLASPMLWVNDVVVEGEVRQTEDEIKGAGDLLRTREMLSIREGDIENGIAALPWIEEVDVTVSLRGVITIDVRESEPAGVAFLGQPYIVATTGRVVRPWTPADGEILPLWVGFVDRIAPGDVTALTGTPDHEQVAIDSYSFHSARAMLAEWAARDLGEGHAVREVHLHPALGYRLVLADGTEVRLGDERVGDRLDRLERVLVELESRGLRASVIHANATDIDRVVVRPVETEQISTRDDAAPDGGE
jgi:cell division septal protein FtsQ